MRTSNALRLVGVLAGLALGVQASYIITAPPSSPITPSKGTPVFVQAPTPNSSGSATTSAVSFSSLPTVGNVVIVDVITVVSSADSLNSKVTDNQGGGNLYTRVFLQGSASNPVVTEWCAPVIVSAGTFTMTATNPSSVFQGIFAREYSGMSCNGDKAAGGTGNTSPYSCGSITTQNAHDLVSAFLGFSFGGGGTISYTAPTGFTIRASQTDGNKIPVGSVADNIRSATGTFTPTYQADQNVNTTPCLTSAILSK